MQIEISHQFAMPPSRFVIKVNNNLIKRQQKTTANYKTKHRNATQKKNQKPTEQNQPLNAAGKEQSRTNRPAKSRQQLAETSRSPTGRHYRHRPLCVSWPTAAHRRIRRACATHRCVWLPVVSMRDGLNMWIRRVQYLRTYLT